MTRRILAAFLLVALGTGTGLTLGTGLLAPPSSDALWTERRPLSILDIGRPAPDWVRIARRLRPAVVHIGAWRMDAGKPIYLGLGSGLIVNPRGYIVTNRHVIAGARELRVKLGDARELIATVVGQDASADLALLKIEAADLPVIPLGDSSALRVGEPVMAIGNPLGLDQTATVGIVSALDRQLALEPNSRFIQTDARINPGNSGGPLINRHGQAIGINTVILTQAGGNTGIGFAIPTRVVEPILARLAAEGGPAHTDCRPIAQTHAPIAPLDPSRRHNDESGAEHRTKKEEHKMNRKGSFATGMGLALMLGMGLTAAVPTVGLQAASAQEQAQATVDGQAFRVNWTVNAGAQGKARISGYVYNDNGNPAEQVQIRITELDASGQAVKSVVEPIDETVPAFDRAYFDVQVPGQAASYRVAVEAFSFLEGTK